MVQRGRRGSEDDIGGGGSIMGEEPLHQALRLGWAVLVCARVVVVRVGWVDGGGGESCVEKRPMEPDE